MFEAWRRLIPALVIWLFDTTSVQLGVSLFLSYVFAFTWREAEPSWDVSSNLLGYAGSWFVIMCIYALVFSTTMADLHTDGRFLAVVLVVAHVIWLSFLSWLQGNRELLDSEGPLSVSSRVSHSHVLGADSSSSRSTSSGAGAGTSSSGRTIRRGSSFGTGAGPSSSPKLSRSNSFGAGAGTSSSRRTVRRGSSFGTGAGPSSSQKRPRSNSFGAGAAAGASASSRKGISQDTVLKLESFHDADNQPRGEGGPLASGEDSSGRD